MLQNNLFFKRLLVFVCPVLVLVFWQLLLAYNRAAVEIGILSLVIVGVTVWQLTNRTVAVGELQKKLHQREFWRFLLTPIGWLLANYFFIMILESGFWRQTLVLLTVVVLFLLLQNFFDRFYRNANYPARSFESISGNINLLSLFFFTAVFYSFIVFLDFSAWIVAIFLLLAVTLLSYQTFWISGLSLKQSWIFLIINDLILLELFWVLVFLPNTYYVKALVVTVGYYILVGLSRNQLLGLVSRKMVLRYLLIGVILLAIVLGTAQWL